MWKRILPLLFLVSVADAQIYTISTVAGGGPATGGLATSYGAFRPAAVAIDSAGNLYVAFDFWCQVWVVNTSGILVQVIGNGACAFAGDGGPAASSSLNGPKGLAVDASGNVYIADSENFRIRKVSGGIITTVAGNGTYGYNGDGTSATSAELSYPYGVAVDGSGSIYIADVANQRIRKVSGGIITTVAGNGTAGYNGDGISATSAELNEPWAVAVDNSGNLYIADLVNNRIRKVSGGTVTTVAGTGTLGYNGDNITATSAELFNPSGLAADSSGNLYIADTGNNRIREVTQGVITTLTSSLNNPASVATAAGNVYVADTFNNRVGKVSGGGTTTVVGNGMQYGGDGANAANSELTQPRSSAVDSSGNLFIADTTDCVVRKVASGTGIISTFVGNGTCGYNGDGIPPTSAQLNTPTGVAVDGTGNLYIADANNFRVRKVSGGVITTVAGNGTAGYNGDNISATSAELDMTGIAVDGALDLYIADSGNNRVRKVSGGIISTIAGDGTAGYNGDNISATSAELNNPNWVAVDSSGNIYIADAFNYRIRKLSGGIITTVAGTGAPGYNGDNINATSAELYAPWGVTVDSAGSLYIADTANNRIRKVVGGIITTIAGTGTSGLSGDGGLAAGAALNSPFGVGLDSGGNVYVADWMNNRIRKLTPGSTVAITVTSTPIPLTVVVDGASITTPQTFNWTPGSSHTFSASTQSGGSGIQYVPGTFAGSQSFSASSSFNIPFTTQYYLTTSAGTGGTISPPSGWYNAGTGVSVSATANTGYIFSGFSGALTGTTTPQTVTMNAAESVTANFTTSCTYTLTPTSASLGAGAISNGSVAVSAPTGCPWSASSNSPWASTTSSGSGNGTAIYSVQNNALSGGRSGSLTIAGITFPLTQAGQGCQITLNPTSASLGSGAGSGSFSLGLSGSDCTWTAAPSSSSTFVTVNSGNSGTGTSGTIGYSLASNPPPSVARTGAIDISVTSPSVASTQAVFNVTQAGATCNYTLSQPSQAFSSSGGTGSVGVVTQGGCAWSATSNNTSWLTINSAANGTVTYTVSPNPSSVARSGSLTIAGVSYIVTQAGTTTAPSCAASMQNLPQVAVEGRTEVVGTLVLNCTGFSSPITADIFLTLNTSVTNAIISGTTSDAALQVNGTATQDGQVVSYSTIHWPGVILTPVSGGTSLSVTIGNVRADASLLAAGSAITGQVSVNSTSTEAVPVTNANLTMATAATTLALSVGTAYSGSGGYILPLIYQEVVSPSSPPLRFRMVLTNVPTSGTLFAPVNPMGGPSTVQLYSADCSGSGGTAISGTLQGAVLYSPLTVTGGVTTATWVVQPGTPITALTFPLLWTGPASALTQIQVIGSYAPVSPPGTAACGSADPSATAVPRYRDFSVPLQFSNFRVTPMITMSNTGFVTYSASVTDESGQSDSQSARPLAIAPDVKEDVKAAASNSSTATLSCVLVGASGASGICSPPTGTLTCSGTFQLSPPYPPNAPLSCGVTSPNPPANGGGAVDVVAVPAMNVQVVQPPLPPQTVSGTFTFTGIAIDPLVSVGSVSMTVLDVNNNVVASGSATIGVSNTTLIPLITTDCNAYSQWFGCPNIGFTWALNTTLLPNGTYTVQALATNTDTPTQSVASAKPSFLVYNVPQGPSLTITSPANGATVTTATITVYGTASDAGLGNNGISSVTVNGVLATGGTATGANTANWSAQITLVQGANTITVVASDASSNENKTTQPITVTLAASNPGTPGCVGMFSDATNLDCSAMNQSVFQGNPAVSIGVPTTYYGAMTLVGNVAGGDAAGMALYNAGGGGGASVSLDLYNTAANGGIPQAKIKAIDDGNYSDNLTFWTKTPGASNNPVIEKVRITSTGSLGIGTTTPTLGPLQMGSGAYVSAGGVWTNASDRNLKENFAPVVPSAILQKIDALPVTEWNYINEDPTVRHVGPVAQDFFSIFGVGNSSISISTIDPSGIALAGIQGLDQKSQGRAAQIAALKKELEAKTEELRVLQERLARLESLFGK